MKRCSRLALAIWFVAVLYAHAGVSVLSAREVLPRPEPSFWRRLRGSVDAGTSFTSGKSRVVEVKPKQMNQDQTQKQ